MAKKKDDAFIYTTNNKKLGAKVAVKGEPGLGIVKNGKIEGEISVTELIKLLFDSQKPYFQDEQ